MVTNGIVTVKIGNSQLLLRVLELDIVDIILFKDFGLQKKEWGSNFSKLPISQKYTLKVWLKQNKFFITTVHVTEHERKWPSGFVWRKSVKDLKTGACQTLLFLYSHSNKDSNVVVASPFGLRSIDWQCGSLFKLQQLVQPHHVLICWQNRGCIYTQAWILACSLTVQKTKPTSIWCRSLEPSHLTDWETLYYTTVIWLQMLLQWLILSLSFPFI